MDTKTEYIKKHIKTWLSFILASGDRGYKQPIVALMDNQGQPPSEANNFLLNKEGTKFAGQFRNSNQQTFEFTISKDGDGWIREFKPSTKVNNNGVK